MNERRARQRLLSKYLIKMDLGDPKAEVMVDKIAKTMNDAEERIAMGRRSKPINVIHPDGTKEWFPSRKEVSMKYDINRNSIGTYIQKGTAHPSGLRFENAERTEPNE